MDKKILLCIFAILSVFTIASCNGDKNTSTGLSNNNNSEILLNCGTPTVYGGNTLFDTEWKLFGFFDAEKNKLVAPERIDCEDCYTLGFSLDSTGVLSNREYGIAGGVMVINGFTAYYIADYTLSTIYFHDKLSTLIAETHDGNKYSNALFGGGSRTFELMDACLKLYYNDKKDYLLYILRSNNEI